MGAAWGAVLAFCVVFSSLRDGLVAVSWVRWSAAGLSSGRFRCWGQVDAELAEVVAERVEHLFALRCGKAAQTQLPRVLPCFHLPEHGLDFRCA